MCRVALEELGGLPGVAASLHTDLDAGLTAVDSSRVDAFGRNVLPEAEQVSLLQLIWEALGDLMIRLLTVAACLSIIFGMTLEDPKTGHVDRQTGYFLLFLPCFFP